MPSDLTDIGKAIERAQTMRAGLIKEIVTRELALNALRARLAGVDMVIAACRIPPAGRSDG